MTTSRTRATSSDDPSSGPGVERQGRMSRGPRGRRSLPEPWYYRRGLPEISQACARIVSVLTERGIRSHNLKQTRAARLRSFLPLSLQQLLTLNTHCHYLLVLLERTKPIDNAQSLSQTQSLHSYDNKTFREDSRSCRVLDGALRRRRDSFSGALVRWQQDSRVR